MSVRSYAVLCCPGVFVLLLLSLFAAKASANQSAWPDTTVYESNNISLGVGLGIVQFDSNIKVSDKESGGRRFLDLEGNLDLPVDDQVNTIYGAYRFNDRHSIVFGYFAIKRESRLIDFEANFDDIILLQARVDVEDRSRFYNVGYGYNLFRDNRSVVSLVAGINALDLNLSADARGRMTVLGSTVQRSELAEANVLAPLPLVGLNFGFSFTPRWSISTRIALVTGTYQDVSATISQSSINSLYRYSEHLGFLFGVTYFDTSVEVDDDDEITDVNYGYSGAFLGVHLGF